MRFHSVWNPADLEDAAVWTGSDLPAITVRAE